jgi:DNA-binding Lrp family transcriptional regulator
VLDDLDVTLLEALRAHPRVGVLELSRLVRVARATVQARLQRMERTGVISGYGPDIDLERAGYPVQAFITLEIAQGGLDALAAELAAIPEILEAHSTTGTGDVLCRAAAASHTHLQDILLALSRSTSVTRTTSVVVLGEVVAHRVLPLLRTQPLSSPTRAPHFRSG